MRIYCVPLRNGASFVVRAERGYATVGVTLQVASDMEGRVPGTIMLKFERAELPALMALISHLLEAYYVALGENPPPALQGAASERAN